MAVRRPGTLRAARVAEVLRRRLGTPLRIIPLGFAGAIAVATLVLMTPWAVAEGEPSAPFLVAVFTATSAICVTGHVVVNTPVYWSTFGEAAILLFIQLGGLGVATLATLLALAVARKVGLQSRLRAAAGTSSDALANARGVVLGILATSVVVEGVVAALLCLRFVVGYGEPLPRAMWLGVFHAVSAFNNAGFSLFSDNLIGFDDDVWVTGPIMVAIVLGGIGFPVIREVLARHRPARWSVHTRLTLLTTLVLLVVGLVVYVVLEWEHDPTSGDGSVFDRLWIPLFMSVTARTAGFNTIDYGQATEASLFVTNLLMIVGGGSGGTAGGIKVGTLAVLVVAVVAEARGDSDADVMGRRVPPQVLRQALAVLALTIAVVVVASTVLLRIADATTAQVVFEVVSATATVGLSTGITADLPALGKWLLITCMFVGRIGPVALVSSLALRERGKLYRLPETRPLIG